MLSHALRYDYFAAGTHNTSTRSFALTLHRYWRAKANAIIHGRVRDVKTLRPSFRFLFDISLIFYRLFNAAKSFRGGEMILGISFDK